MAEALDPSVYGAAVAALGAKAGAAGFRDVPVAGISVGGCAESIGTPRRGAFRRRAHAHNHPRDPLFGWICILSTSAGRLLTPTGRPSALLAHEYAHLLAPNSGHGERWRTVVTTLGHPAEAEARRGR
ncbi:MAG: hypothetical protein HS107_03705 [Thermoflexaceae bacterium]|nr:hypothetical protein [Thermoflexaceae bacterium]